MSAEDSFVRAKGEEGSEEDLGTCFQDCNLIASTFEKACHYDASEPAVYAPMMRQIESIRSFSGSAQLFLNSYIQTPVSKSDTESQFEAMTSDLKSTGTQNVEIPSMTSFGPQIGAFLSDTFGKDLMNWVKDCIPCTDRILSLIEVFPHPDLLSALKADVMFKAELFADMTSLLKNIDIYGDYCELMKLLSFMCIPDLQRLIALLMSLILFEAPKLDLQINILMALIAPIFAPILAGITAMLDQFALMVLSPIDCIIDNINFQLKKIYMQMDPKNPLEEMKNGIAELNNSIIEGKEAIQEKLDYYIEQVKKLLGEANFGASAYLKVSFKKLKLIRLISFIAAIITSLSKGQLACTREGRSPSLTELDNFFNNFFGDNSNFRVTVDPNGNLSIDEALPEYNDIYQQDVAGVIGQSAEINNLIQAGSTSDFYKSFTQQIEGIQKSLSSAVKVNIPCRIETTPEDSSKIESWIAELSKTGL